MNVTRRLWYVKRNGRPAGPFPEGALLQDLLLGRVAPETLVSEDQVNWVALASVAEAAQRPAGASDAEETSWEEERRRAMLRWADQRRGGDRRGDTAAEEGGNRRSGRERREAPGAASRPPARDAPRMERFSAVWAWWLGAVLVALAAGIAVLALVYGSSNPIDVRIR